jgi:hypothetical protein
MDDAMAADRPRSLHDLAVLAAQLGDGSLVRQVLERHVDDMDALTAEVRRNVRDADFGDGAPT